MSIWAARCGGIVGGVATTLLLLSGGCSASAAGSGNNGAVVTPASTVPGAFTGSIAGSTATAGRAATATGTGTGGSIVTGGKAGTGVTPSGTGGTAPSAAGSGGAKGAAGMATGTSGQGGGLPPTMGAAPVLPDIKGTCPDFKDGSTIMVAGHKGILIAAGAPGKAGPLLFYWHGTGGSAAEAMRTLPAAVRSEIISAGGIIAAFNGSQSSGTAGDCSGTGAHNIADFDAADQIAACAVMKGDVDPRRIYTTGCSAGGLQTGCMAQLRSSYIAAAAPNSGGVVAPQPWQDMHSPAIFTMHGGASDMVIVTFSQTSATLDMSAKMHGSFVVNCDHGGGHCQAPADLQTAAWKFMKDHPWGVSPSPWAAGIPAGVPTYCKIY